MVDFNKVIKNSNKFRGPAITFLSTGKYVNAPEGTSEYFNFWKAEQQKCIKGYTAEDGDWISGYYYFYLNYCPIVRRSWKKEPDRFGKVKWVQVDAEEFPDFYDYDYYFFCGIQDAEDIGKHMTVAKSRRKGYSLKGASMLVRNFMLIPNSKSYVYAASMAFLTDDGILTKAWGYLDFLNEHTGWKKKRDVIDRKTHKRASFITTDEYGNQREMGYKSEIIGMSLKDKPDAGHPYSQHLYTPDQGLTTWDTIGMGSKLFSPTGEITTVTDVYELGEVPVYKVTFEDGRTVRCTGDHEWEVKRWVRSNKKSNGFGCCFRAYDMTVEDLFKEYQKPNRKANLYRVELPEAAKYDIDLPGIRDYYEKGRQLAEMKLPYVNPDFLTTNSFDRYQLFCGILDVTGTLLDGGKICVTHTSKKFRQTIIELAYSLGIKTATKNGKPNRKNIRFCLKDAYGVSPTDKRSNTHLAIKSIELDGVENSKCVTVDNELHQYLVGDYIRTRNCRGKRGKLIMFEEAGSFPKLTAAWEIARPSVEHDTKAFGLMLAFGTGGDQGENVAALRKSFYDPDSFNCIGFPNIWDEGAQNTKCGFFIPQYTNMDLRDDDGVRIMMDEDGNTYHGKAKAYILEVREKELAKASNSQQADRYVAERCITPAEAFMELSGNIFPKQQLQRHLAHLRTNTNTANAKQVGDLDWVNEKLVWTPKRYGDLTSYHLDRKDMKDVSGSIVIWEHPPKDAPLGLYIGGNDPYDYDQAGTNSLGSTFIYKRTQSFEAGTDIIVAEYTGRPKTAAEYYENVRKLLLYYNARLMYENEKIGLFTYFIHKHSDYLLADQPEVLKSIVPNTKVNRNKGAHCSKEIKLWAEGKIKEWLEEELSPGRPRLTTIFSEPLIEELIAYNDKGNFDRVSAMFQLMIYREQLYNQQVKVKQDIEKQMRLFNKPLFSNDSSFGEMLTTTKPQEEQNKTTVFKYGI